MRVGADKNISFQLLKYPLKHPPFLSYFLVAIFQNLSNSAENTVNTGFLLLKVSVQQTLKCLAVSCFIASHLVNGVMDSVEVEFLSFLSELELALGSAVLGSNALLEVLLSRVGEHFTEELSELGSVLSLFKSSLLPVCAYFRIAFSVGNASHSEVHTDLGTFAVEVRAEPLDYLGVGDVLSDAENVLASENELFALVHDLEFSAGNAALRALLGGSISLVNVSANGTNIFSHNKKPP